MKSIHPYMFLCLIQKSNALHFSIPNDEYFEDMTALEGKYI